MRLASRGFIIYYESHLDTPTHSLYYYFLHFRIIIQYLKQYNSKCKSGNYVLTNKNCFKTLDHFFEDNKKQIQ